MRARKVQTIYRHAKVLLLQSTRRNTPAPSPLSPVWVGSSEPKSASAAPSAGRPRSKRGVKPTRGARRPGFRGFAANSSPPSPPCVHTYQKGMRGQAQSMHIDIPTTCFTIRACMSLQNIMRYLDTTLMQQNGHVKNCGRLY